MKLALYWSYATRSLVRGGQRTVLAIFCVAVGVMAIVALQLVGLSVNAALTSNIVEANGGDLRLEALSAVPLRQRDLAPLEQLKLQGRISDYATRNNIGGTITLPSGQQELFDLVAVSNNFPLVGQANFIAPSHNLTLSSVLTGNNVAISSSVFDDLGAHIGSTYQVKSEDGRTIQITVAAEFADGGAFHGPLVIISQDTLNTIPGPNGAPLPAEYTTVYMTVPGANLNFVEKQLSHAFPTARVISVQDLLRQRQKEVNQIQLFLHIVGLLALFIGGIGIINTMQVLLRRRQVEIAMLKTTGYRQVDLYALFGLEAALLGLVGGVVGTVAGVGASYLVRLVVEQAFFLHLPVTLDMLTIISGLLIGLATALIFGLLPIVQASQVRPLAVLREVEERRGIASRLTSAGLLALLSLLFVALASAILGDVVTAVVAVYGGAVAVSALALGFSLLVLAISKLPVYERPRPRILLWVLLAVGIVIVSFIAFGILAFVGGFANRAAAGIAHGLVGTYVLVVLGGLGIVLVGGSLVFCLATIVDATIMFAPRAWKTAVMLAYRNLGRQRWRTTTTLSALFVGVFAIGLVLTLGQGIKDTINNTLLNVLTYNVFVITPPSQTQAIQAQLIGLKGVDASKTIATTLVRVRPISVAGRDANTVLKILAEGDNGDLLSSIEGFNLGDGGSNVPRITLKSGRNLDASDAGTDNVVVSSSLADAPLHLRVGDRIIVQSTDGSVARILTVVGFYDDNSPTGNPNFGSVLADAGVATQLGRVSRVEIFSLKVDTNAVPALRKHLNQAVPTALVFSFVDLSALINQVLNNLIIMLTTMASLAMTAGLIIMANAVALAMLERRREIGILKSVGHTSNSVLATVLIENGLIGLLGSLVAMLLVVGAITALSKFVFQIDISIGPGLVALTIIVTVLITMFVASVIAWNAVRVRPLEVLRYE